MINLISHIKNTKSNLWWHVLIWIVVYGAYTIIMSFFNDARSTRLINLQTLFIYMLAYYSLKYFLIPKFYYKKNKGPFVLSLIITAVLLYVFYCLGWYYWLGDAVGYTGEYHFLRLQSFLILIVRFYSPALAILAWESHSNHRKEIKRTEQLEKQKIVNELRFLKAQINPHFLFNSLNNLYSFVITESPQAPEMIDRLTHILDYVLYKSQDKNVQLKEETSTIQNYIGLERIRYGDRLQVETDIHGDLEVPISPLILLSIVENAFKHGASGDIDNPKIKINIQADKNELHCRVWNTKSKYQGEINDAYKEGIGLKNIKRQLDIIYPNQHSLEITSDEDSFCVDLILKSHP